MNEIIINPDGSSAVVFGERIIAKKPTELYVNVMSLILRSHPEIIGQKETHFTCDKSRADSYTGTTRNVLISGRPVYIKTGFSTKDKIKGIEKICLLAGISFSVENVNLNDIGLCDDDHRMVETPKHDNDKKEYVSSDIYSFDDTELVFVTEEIGSGGVPSAVSEKKSEHFFEQKAICHDKTDDEKQEQILGSIMIAFKAITIQNDMRNPKTKGISYYSKHYADYRISNIFGKVKDLNYAGIHSCGIVHDNLGDWVLGEHRTPKGKEQLIKDSIPVYEIPKIGKVNAYTFFEYSSFDNGKYLNYQYLVCAVDDVIYLYDIIEEKSYKIGKGNRIINLLSVGELLFVTEIDDFKYVGRNDYEFQMGDFGYTSDDYNAILQLRVIDLCGKELFKTLNIDSIIGSCPIKYSGKEYSSLCFTDTNHNRFSAVKNILNTDQEEWKVKKISDIKNVLDHNNVRLSEYYKIKPDVITYADNRILIWDENKNKAIAYNINEYFKEK
ncbi:hypothetical protein [Ruminococcus sp.]|uniref:hypothetical protein n=1 Tax=Ruminococcus sp. TaxID=41978 RepID=UPI0025D59B87|nr:hypothetical protein [Ruminococcus sp.]